MLSSTARSLAISIQCADNFDRMAMYSGSVFRSIYLRGLLLVGALLTIATLVTTVWVAYERNQNLTAKVKMDLDGLVRFQAAAVSDAMWNLNRDAVREIITGINISPDFHSVRVITQNGNMFAEIPGLPMP